MTATKTLIGSVVALGSTLVMGSAVAQQAEIGWGVSAGVEHTDNVGRVTDNEESDTIGNVGLQLNLRREGRLQLGVGADLQYRKYFDDSFDEELTGFFNGTAVYEFIPERFSWFAQNSFGQTLIDARAVDTAGNRQNTNVFSTGPDIRLPLGSRSEVLIQGRWIDASFDDSDTDNERLTGSLSLIRNLSATSYVSLNGSATRVEYGEVPPNSNYDINSVYVGYGIEGARTKLALTAGRTAQHDFGESTDGPLFSLSVSRQISPRSTLSFVAGTNLVDTLDSFMRDFEGGSPDAGTSDAVVARDVYQEDYLSLRLDLKGDRNAYGLSADWSQEEHERDATLDRERLRFNARISRQLTQKLSASLDGSWNTEDFAGSGIDFDEWSVGAGLNWNFAQGFTLGLRADRFEGSGGTPTGNGVRDFVENRYSLTVSYRPSR